MIPQIIMILFIGLGVGIAIVEHGKPKTGNNNVWLSLISTAILLGLLIWGGFFNCFVN